jgi:sugar porter (SP) family MFS transporter
LNKTLQSEAPRAQRRQVYSIAAVAALGGFLFGFDLSIISGAIIYLKEVFQLSDVEEGFAMGSAAIGCMLGPFFVSRLSDRWGRKKALLASAILFGASTVGTALPGNITEFNIWRIVGGLGVALSAVVAPMYIAEISPPRIRGRLVAVNQLAIVVGSLAANVVAYLLSRGEIENNWRWMFAAEIVPVVLMIVGLAFVPESPRWLAMQGRRTEAQKVLEMVGNPEAAAELQSTTEPGETGRVAELFAPGMRRALLLAVGLAVFQQITGASILFANAPIVFQKGGFDSAADAIGQTIVLQVWNIACTILAMWLVERLGRRPLLLAGLAVMLVGQVATGLAFQMQWHGKSIVAVLLVTIGAYVISIAPLAWITMAELFPTRLRSVGMAVASFALWVAYFVGLQLFPIMRDWFQDNYGTIAGVFYCFAAICGVAIVFAAVLMPETKGRTLEQIGESWQPRPH